MRSALTDLDAAISHVQMTIRNERIVLCMPGTRSAPRASASARAIAMLAALRAEFTVIDTERDERVRGAVASSSGSTTHTQLFVLGEFIGGCEVMMEMYRTGELARLVRRSRC